jgi:hypothetical protein
MSTKEEFTQIEKQYNAWLEKHPKGDENYKYFTHMRRTIEFAKHYSEKQIQKLHHKDMEKELIKLLEDLKFRRDRAKNIFDRENWEDGSKMLKNENWGKFTSYSHCIKHLEIILKEQLSQQADSNLR